MKARYAICGLVLAFALLACIQHNAESNPVLLRYETDSGTVYLFPTVHALPDEAASDVEAASDLLPNYIIEAISGSDRLLTEVDPTQVDGVDQETERLAFASGDEEARKSLFEYARDLWEDDEYAKLVALFDEFHESPLVHPRFDRERHEQMRPHQFYFDVLAVTTDLAVENEMSIDAAVTRIAHRESVDQSGLGDILLVNRFADDAPQSMYLNVIKEVAREEPTMDELIDNQKDAIVRNFRTWKNGELPVVTSQGRADEMPPESDEEVHELSVSSFDTSRAEERAEVWITTIREVIASDDVEQVFVAVGMTHVAEVPADIELEHLRRRLAADFNEERVH